MQPSPPRAARSRLRGSALLAVLALSACAPPAGRVDQTGQTTIAGGVFHVTPVRPVAELAAMALAATPPAESGEFRPSDLVELTSLDPTIRLDIRYAGTRNFLGTPLYSQARAFLQRPAAEALVRVQRSLAGEGYGLLVHDAYRPWYVTRIFWDAMPPELHKYVADPAQGSRHNRGCAVDLTLYELKSGREVEMPSLYDEATERAYPTYTGGTAGQRRMRDLLRRHMEAQGFEVYEFEWWHFDYQLRGPRRAALMRSDVRRNRSLVRSRQRPRSLPAVNEVMSAEIAAGNFGQ